MDGITVVDVKPSLVMGVRRTGKYQIIPQLLMELVHFSQKKGVQIIGPPVFVCHEKCAEEVLKANEEGNADVETAFPVSCKMEDEGDIKFYQLSGGKMAKIIHKGPYEECNSTYEKLFAWLEEKGYKITGLFREVYPNDPRVVPPEEIITEIYVPVG